MDSFPGDGLADAVAVVMIRWAWCRSRSTVALTRIPQPDGNDPHDAATAQLEQLILRGQRAGDFDRTLSTTWLAAAILGLTHTAAEQVAAGRLTS